MSRRTDFEPAELILLVARSWKILLAGSVVCSAVMALAILLQPKNYEASATLLVYPPLFKDYTGSHSRPSPDQNELGELAEAMPPALPLETYRKIAMSKDVFAEIKRTLNLDDTTVEALMARCEAEFTPLSRATQGTITYSQTIDLYARAEHPELAASLADTWASIIKQRLDDLSFGQLDVTHELILRMLESTKTDLEKAQQELVRFQDAFDLQYSEKHLDNLRNETLELRSRLVEIGTQIASKEATLSSFSASAAKEPEVHTLFRAPPDSAYWLLQRNSDELTTDEDIATLGLRTEHLNPNYLEFKRLVGVTEGELRGLEKEQSATLKKVEALESEAEQLYRKMIERQMEESWLKKQVEILERSYTLVADNLEKTKIARLNRASDIHTIGDAIVPTESDDIPGAFMMLTAFVVGGLLAALAVLSRHILDTIAKDAVAPGAPLQS